MLKIILNLNIYSIWVCSVIFTTFKVTTTLSNYSCEKIRNQLQKTPFLLIIHVCMLFIQYIYFFGMRHLTHHKTY